MLTVIGCGNPLRSDDGVGSRVVSQLLRRLGTAAGAGFQLIDAGTDGMSVMFRARGSSGLILVDACRSGSEPGTIHAVPGDRFDDAPETGLNLHEFRWNHALYAGRRIFGAAFPAEVTVYLIESASLAHGIGLSPAVERAAGEVADRIAARLAGLAQPAPPPEAPGAQLTLARGALHLARAVYERYFPGVSAVALLARERDLVIMPVGHAASGGYVMKVRNARGDRVVDAVDFCRAHGLEAPGERPLAAFWQSEVSALVVPNLLQT